MKIQVLSSKNSWLNLNKKKFVIDYFKKFTRKISLINDFKKINKDTELLIILSFYKIIPEKYLKISKYNLVVHESDLPRGRGHSPLFWQILQGKTKIIFTLFEASKKIDFGKYYFKKKFFFKNTLLYNEIKNLQLKYALELVSKFVKKYKKNKLIKRYNQNGKSNYYKIRNKNFSEISLNKSIKQQINLLRICSNKDFPAFFYYKNKKYVINIFKDSD